MRMLLWVGTLLGLTACPLEFPEVYDSGASDAASARPDSTVADVVTDRTSQDVRREGGTPDSAVADTVVSDARPADTSVLDSGASDSASGDQTGPDTASPDTAPSG